MDKNLIEQYREKLLTEKNTILEELKRIADPDKAGRVPGDYATKYPNYGDDPYTEQLDTAPSEEEDYEINLSVTGTLGDRLQNVEAALERIDADEYGICAKCKNEISEARLESNPAAELCVDCARQTA